MKYKNQITNFLLLLIFIFLFIDLKSQDIVSGEYDSGLKIAFDKKTKIITGYFEDYTGWDEELNLPRFSCIFYFHGKLADDSISIISFYPEHNIDEQIYGYIKIPNNKSIIIKLNSEHGGCWNVKHFADSAINFNLVNIKDWIQIRYVKNEKVYFYLDSIDKKNLTELNIKNNILFINKLEGDWALCTYYDEKTITGWVNINQLNVF